LVLIPPGLFHLVLNIQYGGCFTCRFKNYFIVWIGWYGLKLVSFLDLHLGKLTFTLILRIFLFRALGCRLVTIKRIIHGGDPVIVFNLVILVS